MATPKVIRSTETEIPHGTEFETEIKFHKDGEEPVRLRQFMRRIDMGDSYTILLHMAKGSEPAHVVLTTGIKGQVQGEHRLDQVEVVILGADGTVMRTPAKEVKVLLSNPYAGMGFEETLQAIARDRPTGSCSIAPGD